MRTCKSLACAILLLTAAPLPASVAIGSGARLDAADAVIDLGCGDLAIAGQLSGAAATIRGIANLDIAGGTLSPGSSSLTLGGNFANAGTFLADASRLSVVDVCGTGTSTFSGATTFYELLISTASGKHLVLPAALTQDIQHALGLQGAAGNLLQVLSSAAGQQALIHVGSAATQGIAYVDARDNKASGATIAPGTAASYNSVDGGNLVNWFVGAVTALPPVPAPAIGLPGRLALLAMLVWIGQRMLRRGRPR